MSNSETQLKKIATSPATTQPTPIGKRFSNDQINAAQLDQQTNLPNLSKAQKHFVPLTVEYWSPASEGDEKMVFVAGIDFHEVPDMETEEIRHSFLIKNSLALA